MAVTFQPCDQFQDSAAAGFPLKLMGVEFAAWVDSFLP